MKRKFFAVLSVCFSLPIWATTSSPIDTQLDSLLKKNTVDAIHTALFQKKYTCTEVIKHYIDRIKRYNLSTFNRPPINAIARINLNIFEQAKKIDALLTKKVDDLSLLCVPILLKDNINSYDSPSQSGSLSLLGNQALEDALLVKRLREAGAIILGKSTMDEFASGIYGISSANGRTGNVYDTSQNSGGSSSGSAAAIGAQFSVISIGTDNSGSIRIPAAFNGVFGLRPSTGLISQEGIFPRGNLDGTAGPMAQTVEDLALTLDVIAQSTHPDFKEPSIKKIKSYTAYLNPNGLQHKRIGVVRLLESFDTFHQMPASTQQQIDNALQAFRQLGATMIDHILLPQYNLERQFNEAGESEDINRFLASYPATRKNTADICTSNRTQVFGDSKACLKFFSKLPPKNSAAYQHALAIFLQNKRYVENIMKKNRLDALLVPVSRTGSATDADMAMINETIASNAGLPGLTLNIGYTPDTHMPIGIELIGQQFAEGTLIQMAYAYEKNVIHFIPPLMPPSDKLGETLDLASYNNLISHLGYQTYQQFRKENISKKNTAKDLQKYLTAKKFFYSVKGFLYPFQSSHKEEPSSLNSDTKNPLPFFAPKQLGNQKISVPLIAGKTPSDVQQALTY